MIEVSVESELPWIGVGWINGPQEFIGYPVREHFLRRDVLYLFQAPLLVEAADFNAVRWSMARRLFMGRR